MRRFEGQRVIVTGGAMGIGRPPSRASPRRGARRADRPAAPPKPRHARSPPHTGATSTPSPPIVGKADNLAAVQFALDAMGGVDVLVNNAGIYYEAIRGDHRSRWDEIMKLT